MYQPEVWQGLTSTYQEIKPDNRLNAYIQSYWFSHGDRTEEPARIIPDLCSDLIVQLSPELDILSIELCGPSTNFFYSIVEQPVIYLGIRFYLGGLYPFFNHSFKEMKNQLLALNFIDKVFANDLADVLSGKKSFAAIIKSVDFYFLKRFNRLETKKISQPVREFITSHYETIDYRKEGINNLISERSLQRLFREETGLSPYEAFDVLRFQKVYQELLIDPQIKQLDLVEKYHFFDQAHYTRKMKKMTGLTPSQIKQHVGILQDKY